MGLGFRVWGLRFGVWGLGLRVRGLEFGGWGSGFEIRGSGFRVWGMWFRVWGLGFRGSGSCSDSLKCSTSASPAERIPSWQVFIRVFIINTRAQQKAECS